MGHAIRPDSIQPWPVDFDETSSCYQIRNFARGPDPRIIASGIRVEKDAFFIAHAANVHDELVQTLRKINRVVSEYSNSGSFGTVKRRL
jgi:hypothetical protein